ncbi:MAG TPA: hypothetical protein VGL11_15100 [Candidatus Binatia bacterium]
MNKVSLIIAVVGVFASGVAVVFLKDRPPRHSWLLGIAGLFPAWLIAFLTVIQPASQSAVDVPLPPRALLSSAAGLIGIIATDYLLRRSQESGRVLTAVMWWMIGWASLVPAWLIVSSGF